MKIAHLTSAHPRDDIRIFTKECRSLAAAGHDLMLVVADGLGPEVRDGVRILDVGRARGRFDRMFRVTRRMQAQALALEADVYHFHDPELLPVGGAMRRAGKRVVFDAHEDVPKQLLGKHYLGPITKSVLSFVFAVYERLACRRLDGIITATPNIRDKFLRINGNTIDINNFPMIGELEGNIGWDRKADEVCYVGGIAAIRGIREVVAAMAVTHPRIRLNLVGGFAEADVEQEVGATPGWQQVNALGVRDRVGVRDVLARSRAGIVTFLPVPNHVDAQPNKMFEYMSAGVPVIASHFPLWREIVEGNDCGLCVDPQDPAAIAGAVNRLVDDSALAQRLGENGRRAVMERYNWAAEEKKLLAFYERLQGRMACEKS
ncbi:glycosyltransferase family 4 protein [Acidovorax sp. K2F]|uniref:glycosyltransferase family 4 protein n=1 Tax=Acidovorax sp. K2F TaxID=2978125 RepID=UPI0021B0D5F6|nr:glycosyltransferase family 4 protein [Acidovorax sp. K2F]MCT6718331.1 glycosyltransferase family 4 protein [Acidovorax sp. K2F]